MAGRPDNQESQERRSHPRVRTSVPVPARIRCWAELGEEQAQLCDISCSGLYCTVPSYIPPLTRVDIILDLPLFEGGERRRETVEFEGAVVRSEQEEDADRYGIAIFFSGLTERARRLISRYVSQVQKASSTR